MTVRELLDGVGSYLGIRIYPDTDLLSLKEAKEIEKKLNDTVCIVDDGIDSNHWKISMVAGKNFDREIKPAKIEMKKGKLIPTCCYCCTCKNMIPQSRRIDHRGFPSSLISCNNPRSGKIIEDVIEYKGSKCMDYDPIKEEIGDIPVQVEPPEYKTESILGIFRIQEKEK